MNLCDLVQPIARSRDNIVKKQALTYEEIEAEREEVSNRPLLQSFECCKVQLYILIFIELC